MERLLKVKEVMDRVGLSRSQIYRLMDVGEFPLQISVGGRGASWVASEIEEWIQQKIEERGR